MPIKQNAANLAAQLKIGVLISLIYLATAVCSSPQCNLGLKLFSIEGGKAVCAPIVPFQCVESCEWINSEENGGCERSSHFMAFRGRRTYLSGIVLSEQNILLQCCASLATTVELDDEREAACYWSEEIETVVGRPNVRFERVLGQTEYYRNLQAVRNGRSTVKVRAEVCHYTSERTLCNRNKMSGDDFHKYSLLLMRLQRAKEFMQMKTDVLEPNEAMLNAGFSAPLAPPLAAGKGVRENETNQSELIRKAPRAMFRNRTNPIGPLMKEGRANGKHNRKEEQLLVNGEVTDDGGDHHQHGTAPNGPKLGAKIVERFGRRFWGEKEEIVSPSAAPSIGLFSNWSSSSSSSPSSSSLSLSSSSSSSVPSLTPTTTPFYDAKTTKMAIPTKMVANTWPTKPFFIDPPSSNERILFNDPRKQTKRREMGREKGEGSDEVPGQKAKNFSRMNKTAEPSPVEPPAHNNNKDNNTNINPESNTNINPESNTNINPESNTNINLESNTNINPESTMGPQHLAIRRIRYPHQTEERKAPRTSDSRMSWPRGAQRRRFWPVVATNTTKELIPANTDQKWTDGNEYLGPKQGRDGQQIRIGKAGKNWHNLRHQMNNNYSLGEDAANVRQQKQNPITIRPLSLSHHHELRIKKLSQNSNGKQTNLGVKCLPAEESREKQILSADGSAAAGAGGSFASAELLDEVGQPIPTLSVPPKVSPQISTHPLEKAPQFKFVSLIERPSAAVHHHHHQPQHGRLRQQFGTANVGSGGAVENIPRVGDRLMECCQQQAPGCRAICRRDVNKEQVKKVMVSGQCPPVTMTGVIQCFPRFLNISSVSKCCALRTKIGESGPNSMPQQSKVPTNLPLQCLSLCAPNFHLTFGHLACVEHIEHILDCYRQLLDDENALGSTDENWQEQKMIGLSSHSPPFS